MSEPEHLLAAQRSVKVPPFRHDRRIAKAVAAEFLAKIDETDVESWNFDDAGLLGEH